MSTGLVGIAEGTGIAVGAGEGVGAGVIGDAATELLGALSGIPLLQINLLCFFKQVNIFPLCMEVVPSFVHFAPAFGGMAIEFRGSRRLIKRATSTVKRNDGRLALRTPRIKGRLLV